MMLIISITNKDKTIQYTGFSLKKNKNKKSLFLVMDLSKYGFKNI